MKWILPSLLLLTIAGCGAGTKLGSQINNDYTIPPDAQLEQKVQRYFQALHDEDWETLQELDINMHLLSLAEIEKFYQSADRELLQTLAVTGMDSEWLASQFHRSSRSPFGSTIRGNATIAINRSALGTGTQSWSGQLHGHVQFQNGLQAPYYAFFQKQYGSDSWDLRKVTIFQPSEPTACQLTRANLQTDHRVGVCNLRYLDRGTGMHHFDYALVEVDFAYEGPASLLCFHLMSTDVQETEQRFPTETAYLDRHIFHYPCIQARQSGTATVSVYSTFIGQGVTEFTMQVSEFVEPKPTNVEWLAGEAASEIMITPIHLEQLTMYRPETE